MLKLGVPNTVHASFQGTAQAFQEFSLKDQPIWILAALAAVYIVLGILYESFIHLDHDFVDDSVRWHRRVAGLATDENGI